ncbi:cob(I)yrinic acid a,c-diamide adenosyltransferase [Candidatus Woesearchaeota archaeon]|jgi:cob(I)alamin adenosyltransferase|nr:cob(I)yrinic acid a,c-diamide adenosyltransferase [Candidatus Woesearchaeota archaeon]MBT5396622.1 cob(I)yrinic acid a,c-diamide adenosyltransferase [Candidatus Woesearchaeota archaeon]MBT5924889.1 cob(I)yrinic acid a,c-diamide adenosyltransferase [Candidatus Woesearchaeota archaeon]MBT6367591.1 cob(I)yrinic acid a,c-diamide adenosyltransferase [Candidatus Woesearchaeota archaeon]MBT7763090.1 cob(I)yrinic acid a,c-diamide adenosyltransferase [Candidatus Woesearchaeota archaeon]
MKIYTKVGDEGKTAFFGCGMVAKDDPRIEALGALDEINSVIGVTLCFVENENLRDMLQKIQNDLFQVGSDLSGSSIEETSVPRMKDGHVAEIESHIDELEEKLGMPQKFILPGGTVASSFLHMCRTITRRAERELVKTKSVIDLNPAMLRYINRLSDLLFVLARDANKELDVKEQQPIYKYFEK